MIRYALPLFALSCAACTQGRPETQLPAAPSGTCSAEALTGLLGKTRSEAVATDAMRLSGAKTLRWIEPGMAVTMDFRADRLNLYLDAQGRIERTGCS